MNRVSFLALYVLFSVSLSAQTINRVDYIGGPTINGPLRWTGEVIENEGKFYIYRGPISTDYTVNDTLVREIKFGDDELGFPTFHSLIPIYEIDKGFTDHIAVEFAGNIGFHAKDSLIAIAGRAKYLVIQDDTIYGDFINGEVEQKHGFFLVGDEGLNINLLERTIPAYDHQTHITDDAIYLGYNWFTNIFYPESIFMGENFEDGDENPDILLHKMDRNTYGLDWSRRIATHGSNDFIRHFTSDNEGNIIIVIEGAGQLFYGDSLITENYFPENYYDDFNTDFYMVKISPEGELLNYLVYHGNGAEIITDFTFNEKNEMLVMGSLETIGNAYLGNQVVEIEQGNIPGYIAKYDADWNMEWYKLYDGYLGYVSEAIFDGEEIIASYQSILNVSDDDEVFDDPENQGSFHIHKLDKNGNEISETISGGREGAIVDIKKIGENRHLILVLEKTFVNSFNFSFFDYEIENPFSKPRLFMFDISGDLLESVTAISELIQTEKIIAFPNPMLTNQTLNIKLPNRYISSECLLTITTIDGISEISKKIKTDTGIISIPPEKLKPGKKIVTIRTNNQLYSTQIMIN